MIRVILCAHNGASFIEQQLESIVSQSEPRVDAIHLFVFLSSDGTEALAGHLADRWPQIDLTLVPRIPGVVASFFEAFARIEPICGTDDVIFLADQDDVWLPGKVGRMLEAVSEFPIASNEPILAFHDVRVCDENLAIIRDSFYDNRPFEIPRNLSKDLLLFANPVIGHTVALNRTLLRTALQRISYREYMMHDWALVLIAAFGGKIVFVPQALSLYRQHGNNILGTRKRRSLLGQFRRANEFSSGLVRQTRALLSDLRDLPTRGDLEALALPGRGSTETRLAKMMILRGRPVHWLLSLLVIFHGFRLAKDSSGFAR